MLDTLASVADAHDRTGLRADGAGAPPGEAPSFREAMSALNPLQHLPLVGPVYRAVSGDTLSEPARRVGSFVASGLLFGPLGLLSNAVTALAERVSGFSLEDGAQSLLAAVGLGGAPARDAPARDAPAPDTMARGDPPEAPMADGAAPAAGPGAAPGSPGPETSGPALAAGPDPAPAGRAGGVGPPSPLQLAAYGMTRGPGGLPRLGALEGAEALNAAELVRIGAPPAMPATALAAYSRAAPLQAGPPGPVPPG